MKRSKYKEHTINCRGMCKDCKLSIEKQLQNYRDWLAKEISNTKSLVRECTKQYGATVHSYTLDALRQCAKQLREKTE